MEGSDTKGEMKEEKQTHVEGALKPRPLTSLPWSIDLRGNVSHDECLSAGALLLCYDTLRALSKINDAKVLGPSN
jgi:hypothetical protein